MGVDRIRVGLIGCGRISKNHFESLMRVPDVELTCVADVIEERALEASKKYDIPKYYSNYMMMLEENELDLVSICTPSGTHSSIGIDVSRFGVNVLTEKPMATNVADANKLIQACDSNSVKLFVVKQNRLNSTLQALKSAIEKDRFGRIYLAQANVLWQRPQSYYDAEKWRGTWEFDGGAFMNQASHYVDAIYWLLGNVASVTAVTATMARKIEAEDTGCAILQFRNGAIATINVTMLTYPKNYEGSITIIGEKGLVKIGGVAVNKVEKWEFEDYDDDDKAVSDISYNTQSVYGYGHQPYYENVIGTLTGNTDASTDGRDGRKSVEIIEAIYKSAKVGSRVHLPL